MMSMGKTSRRSYSRSLRVGSREREILNELTAGDMLIGFLCSARSTRRMYSVAHARARERYLTKQAADRLTSHGYILRHGDAISLSKRGRALIETSVTTTRLKLTKSSWDGKWRIVIYDIPNEFDHLRYQVRAILGRAGFKQLQKSVWIFPHECKELTKLIKKDPRLGPFVLYATVEFLEGDLRLRSHFKLV